MRKPWVPGYEKLCDQHKNSFRTTIGKKKILIGVCWEKGLKENRGAITESYFGGMPARREARIWRGISGQGKLFKNNVKI